MQGLQGLLVLLLHHFCQEVCLTCKLLKSILSFSSEFSYFGPEHLLKNTGAPIKTPNARGYRWTHAFALLCRQPLLVFVQGDRTNVWSS